MAAKPAPKKYGLLRAASLWFSLGALGTLRSLNRARVRPPRTDFQKIRIAARRTFSGTCPSMVEISSHSRGVSPAAVGSLSERLMIRLKFFWLSALMLLNDAAQSGCPCRSQTRLAFTRRWFGSPPPSGRGSGSRGRGRFRSAGRSPPFSGARRGCARPPCVRAPCRPCRARLRSVRCA